MKVYLNSSERDLPEDETLGEFLRRQKLIETTGIAVAVNDVVIARSQWTSHLLSNGDKILIITATAGG